MSDQVLRHRLENGLQLIALPVAGVSSAAVGVQVGAGTRYEQPHESGSARTLEFWCTLGARGQDHRAWSDRLEDWGVRKESAPNVEWTRYWATVDGRGLTSVLGALGDAVTAPTLADGTFEAARSLAAQQARTRLDEPHVYTWDLLRVAMAGGHPLGRPAVGRHEEFAGLTPETVRAAHRRLYTPANTVVVGVGRIGWDSFRAAAEESFGQWAPGDVPAGGTPPEWHPCTVADERETQHVHLGLGIPGPSYGDRSYFPMALLVQALGGGGGSRLFEEVREKRGLAYQVRARLVCHADSGLILLYVGTRPDRAAETLSVLWAELQRAVRKGFSNQELELAKRQLLNQMVMRGESTVARMHTLVTASWYNGQGHTLQELHAGISAVTAADIHEAVTALPLARAGLSSVGPFSAAALQAAGTAAGRRNAG